MTSLRFYLLTGRHGEKAIYFKIAEEKHPFMCKEWATIKLIGEYTLNKENETSADFNEYFSKHILPYLAEKQSSMKA